MCVKQPVTDIRRVVFFEDLQIINIEHPTWRCSAHHGLPAEWPCAERRQKGHK